ncbi:MAG TPA: hypothetical protein VGK63_04355, partial [Candidatus Limnocylindrales bacterium]
AVVAFNSVIYVFGGSDDSGKAQPDAYILSPDQSTGELRDWQTADDAKLPIDLPEPRTGAVAIAVADVIVVAGGYDDSGKPSATVWKSTTDSQGKLGKWVEQAPLHDPQADAIGAQAGSWLWVYGGVGADGQPTNVVQRGNLGTAAPSAAGASAGPGASGAAASPGASGAATSPGASGGAAAASPAASAAAGGGNDIVSWQVASAVNLPGPRANPAGFAANGTLYLVGGADASGPQPQLYWAIPDGGGNFTEWKHLPQSDLPAGLTGSSAVVLGSDAILVGGQASAGVIGDEYRSNLAPQPPFFQLGLVGATVPALKIEGEIGQQLGYLNAAGLSTIDFIVLVLIGWAYAHREQTRALFERLRRRRQR